MSSTTSSPRKVPFGLRVGIFFVGLLLTILFIWLLSFVLDDISRMRGPDYTTIIEAALDPEQVAQRDSLNAQIAEQEKQSGREKEIQADLKRSMENGRSTMQQMMDLHRLSLEKQSPPSEQEKEALATAQQRFLKAQNEFEESNARITASSQKRFELKETLNDVSEELSRQEEPAREAYYVQQRKHQLKLAGLKLLVIVPIFLIAVFLLYRYRRTPYRPVLLAAVIAAGVHLAVIMHLHFPSAFFKYIAIVVGIVAVLAFMVWLVRKAAKPDRNLLLKRYREAYRGHSCPICAYPIGRGPMRFAVWTRKGPVLSAARQPETAESGEDEPYSCPSCGTGLFDRCGACSKSRHSLLSFCEHCGDERQSA